jgi:hypothetical protein
MMVPTLATKISVAIIGVLALALMSSFVAIRSAYRFQELQQTLVADNLASVRAAEELEIALLEQRGHVASYLLDNGNRKWLSELDRHRAEFESWLRDARQTARSDAEREILDELQVIQAAYTEKRDSVVTLYDAGQIDQARRHRSQFAAWRRFQITNDQSWLRAYPKTPHPRPPLPASGARGDGVGIGS